MATVREPDYYRVLGVNRDASLDAIKKAYHRLAAQYHPDRHPDDPDAEARLRSLNQAYTVLRDPERRACYDRWGAWGPPPWHPPATATTRAWIAAAVQHLLNAREQLEGHRPRRGQDLRYRLRLSPTEGERGVEAHITLPAVQWCPHCAGSGGAKGKPPFPCPQCRGAREVSRPGWLLITRRVCDVCQGEGMVITDPCPPCGGRGIMQMQRTLLIDVPRGVRHGSRLRLRGQGGPGIRGGAPGDLYIDIQIVSQAAQRQADS